jgi:hypothetical protein
VRRAESAAGPVREAAARLRAAGARLRSRPQGEVVAALGRLFEHWRDPASASRRRAEAELPAATGFSPEVVREGLARGLAAWTGEAFAALVARELAGRTATGFPLTSVLLAGAIPPPTLLALAAPLALRSPVLARPSSRDPLTPRLVADSLRALDPDLGAALEVVSFPADDAEAMAAFLSAECVVASGSDATLADVAARVVPPQRLVAYGHRLSIAVLGPDALAGVPLRWAAAALALDVAQWDQLGCLSPATLYVVGRREAPSDLLDALANAFAESEKLWPVGEIPAAARAERADARGAAELRDPRAVRADPGARWVVVAEPDAAFRPSPLHRFLRVHPVPDVAALLAALAPLSPHLATVGLAGMPDAAGLAAELSWLGVSRVCPLGRMQTPPLDWSHDNQGVLLPLARLTDIDLG